MAKDNLEKETLYDVRTVNRSISQGRVTEADYAAFLDTVEDSSALADHTVTRMISSVSRTTDPD